jgi:putrescine transport system permease protein
MRSALATRVSRHVNRHFGTAWLVGGYLFLYLPIVFLVVFSFNESKLASIWTRFSLTWYRAILDDTEILDALLVSLKVALLSASASVVLGTLAAFVLVRYRRFRGRALFKYSAGAGCSRSGSGTRRFAPRMRRW